MTVFLRTLPTEYKSFGRQAGERVNVETFAWIALPGREKELPLASFIFILLSSIQSDYK